MLSGLSAHLLTGSHSYKQGVQECRLALPCTLTQSHSLGVKLKFRFPLGGQSPGRENWSAKQPQLALPG